MQLLTELSVQAQIKHSSVIEIKDYLAQTTLIDTDGVEYPVSAIVSELAPHGTLLDILQTGKDFIPEHIVRFYAAQLLQTICCVH